MKTVYVVWYVPDYIGIDILGIFEKEEDAKNFMDSWVKDFKPISSESYGYDVYEVQ